MNHPAVECMSLQMEVEIDKIEQAEQTEAVPTPEMGMQEGAAAESAAEGAQAQEGAGRSSGCMAGCLGDSTTPGVFEAFSKLLEPGPGSRSRAAVDGPDRTGLRLVSCPAAGSDLLRETLSKLLPLRLVL